MNPLRAFTLTRAERLGRGWTKRAYAGNVNSKDWFGFAAGEVFCETIDCVEVSGTTITLEYFFYLDPKPGKPYTPSDFNVWFPIITPTPSAEQS